MALPPVNAYRALGGSPPSTPGLDLSTEPAWFVDNYFSLNYSVYRFHNQIVLFRWRALVVRRGWVFLRSAACFSRNDPQGR